MSRKKKSETVELVNKHGAIARPRAEDVERWLAHPTQGWKRAEPTPEQTGDDA